MPLLGCLLGRVIERVMCVTRVYQSGRQKPMTINDLLILLDFYVCWRCALSDTNPSPCYLANIRVIFENNSEPAAENPKNTCDTGISRR
jgi:hypothetical protein